MLVQDYGAFATAYSIYLFALSVNQGLFYDPMNIVGSIYYDDQRRAYANSIVILQIAVSGILSIAILLLGTLLYGSSNELGDAIFVLAVSLPFMNVLLILRRVAYLNTQPSISLLGSLGYAATLTIAFCFLRSLHRLNPSTAIGLFGFSSGAVSVPIYFVLRSSLSNSSQGRVRLVLKEIATRHWTLGRWLLGASVLAWMGTYLYVPLLGIIGRLQSAASLKALENLMLPMEQVLSVLGTLFIPIIAREYNTDRDSLSRNTNRLTKLVGVITLGYSLLVSLGGRHMLVTLYGYQSSYALYYYVIPILTINLLLRVCSDFWIGIPLRINEKYDAFFKATIYSTVAMLGIGILLVWRFDITGAAIAKVLPVVVQVIVLFHLFKRFAEESVKEVTS